MRKIYTRLIAVCVCVMILCCAGECLAVTANNQPTQNNSTKKDNKDLDILDLIRLKLYIAGMTDDIGDADYNNDGDINVRDIVTLKRIILGLPINPSLDADGYYDQVVKG